MKASFLDGPFAGQVIDLAVAYLAIIVSEELDPASAAKHVRDPSITETRGGEQNVLIVGRAAPWTRYTLGIVDKKGINVYHVVSSGSLQP